MEISQPSSPYSPNTVSLPYSGTRAGLFCERHRTSSAADDAGCELSSIHRDHGTLPYPLFIDRSITGIILGAVDAGDVLADEANQDDGGSGAGSVTVSSHENQLSIHTTVFFRYRSTGL